MMGVVTSKLAGVVKSLDFVSDSESELELARELFELAFRFHFNLKNEKCFQADVDPAEGRVFPRSSNL